ncbi:hypothetical protein [Effusibacillus dendaii]|uniref:hypothetical protein n=1 Tax=Effusibacillus dendaii TaxID=2743772 RepID=UPI0019096395|nr:hypothetical protein [Effusibacillus dendaii]
MFSGDIGSAGQAIVCDPEKIEEADYVFVESTYGNRLHPPVAERSEQLLAIIRAAQKDNGLVIIPAFVFFLIVWIIRFLERISTRSNKIQVTTGQNDVWVVDPDRNKISVYRLNPETNQIE